MNLIYLPMGLISLTVVMNLLVWKIFDRKVLNRLITLCIWAALSMWYTIPSLIAGFYREETPFFPLYLDSSSATNEVWFEDFCKAFFLESAAVCFVLAGILVLHKMRRRHTRQKASIDNADTQSHYLINNIQKIVALLLFLTTLIYQATQVDENTYLLSNSSDLYGSSSGLVLLVKQLTMSVSILIALYEPRGSYFLYGAFGLVTLDAYFTSLGGNRIILLIPIVLAAFRSLLKNKNISSFSTETTYEGVYHYQLSVRPRPRKNNHIRLLILFITVVSFLWFVFIPIAQSIERVRLEGGTLNWGDVASEAFSQENDKKLALSSIFWKLDSFTGGSILTREAGYGDGGINPYIGSLLVIIPRTIVPNRPVAGTSDGTIETYPSRLVPKLLGIKSNVLNVGISPLHIALWQFGYLGFFVFVVANILYFKLLDGFLGAKDFALQTLGVYSVSFPTFVTVFLSPDAALKNVVFIMFFIVVLKFFKIARKLFRSKSNPDYPKVYNSKYRA